LLDILEDIRTKEGTLSIAALSFSPKSHYENLDEALEDLLKAKA
jgi:hypothetical protein